MTRRWSALAATRWSMFRPSRRADTSPSTGCPPSAVGAAAPVAHADETTARAAGALRHPHVACIEHLTAMHVAGRGADDIDAGGVRPAFTSSPGP